MRSLFVYGTLRLDQHLYHDWLAPIAELEEPEVEALGRMYYVRQNLGYPVVDFEQDGEVIGDLFLVDMEDLDGLISMEVGAGYQLRHVAIRKHDGSYTKALAFHWPHEYRGEPIPSGDWVNRDA